jgi:hypothetical protein
MHACELHALTLGTGIPHHANPAKHHHLPESSSYVLPMSSDLLPRASSSPSLSLLSTMKSSMLLRRLTLPPALLALLLLVSKPLRRLGLAAAEEKVRVMKGAHTARQGGHTQQR